MKLRHLCMTAVAEFRLALMGEQVAIGTAVGRMTCAAAFYSGRGMFKYEGTGGVGVTTATLRLLGAHQPVAGTWRMGIMAGRTRDSAFPQPVSLTGGKLAKGVLVTLKADCGARWRMLKSNR